MYKTTQIYLAAYLHACGFTDSFKVEREYQDTKAIIYFDDSDDLRAAIQDYYANENIGIQSFLHSLAVVKDRVYTTTV